MTGSIKDLFKVRRLTIYLIIMTIMWCTTSYSSLQLIFEMKYLPGNIYSNNILSAIAEILINFSVGILAKAFGLNIPFGIMATMALAGGVSLILKQEASTVGQTLMILMARGGILGCYALLYLGTA